MWSHFLAASLFVIPASGLPADGCDPNLGATQHVMSPHDQVSLLQSKVDVTLSQRSTASTSENEVQVKHAITAALLGTSWPGGLPAARFFERVQRSKKYEAMVQKLLMELIEKGMVEMALRKGAVGFRLTKPVSKQILKQHRMRRKREREADKFLQRHRRKMIQYQLEKRIDQDDLSTIKKDLPRTTVISGSVRMQTEVRSMLVRYVAQDPELGYFQGMTEMAVPFVFAAQGLKGQDLADLKEKGVWFARKGLKGQGNAYDRFKAFMQSIRGVCLDIFDFSSSALRYQQLNALSKETAWYKHFQELGVQPTFYVHDAWLTLFRNWLPLDSRVHCLGILEQEGWPAMLAMTMFLLNSAQNTLLGLRDLGSLVKVLNGRPGKVGDLKEVAPSHAHIIQGTKQLLPAARAAAELTPVFASLFHL